MSVYAYKLAPIYKQKIWGGRNLARLFGRALPPGEQIGESWELADLPEGETRIANGRRTGQSLSQLVQEEGRSILGKTPLSDQGRFPLLLKFLDAEDTLGLQVHPDAQAVKAIPGAAMKTECWYVLDSRAGCIYKGVKPGVTAEQFRTALAGDNVADLLMRFDARPGDFHYLPAGTVHALGAGVVVAEVQTPSDTTYRISDWGRGREVHVERAMQCIRFAWPAEPTARATGECLVRTEHFQVFLRTAGPGNSPLPSGRCMAWMVLEGRGEVRCEDADGLTEFGPGDTLLLPAGMQAARVTMPAPCKRLEVWLPPY